jgi:hypothetical protein
MSVGPFYAATAWDAADSVIETVDPREGLMVWAVGREMPRYNALQTIPDAA